MKKVIILPIIFLLCALDIAQAQNSDTTDVCVVINGVAWTTRNVVRKGKFAAKPEDNGTLFTWKTAIEACPSGYRLPTRAEIYNLIDADSRWTIKNGAQIKGRTFGSGNNTIFLPAAGYVDSKECEDCEDCKDCGNSTTRYEKMRGCYWYDTGNESTIAHYMIFHSSDIDLSGCYYRLGSQRSVRCVAK